MTTQCMTSQRNIIGESDGKADIRQLVSAVTVWLACSVGPLKEFPSCFFWTEWNDECKFQTSLQLQKILKLFSWNMQSQREARTHDLTAPHFSSHLASPALSRSCVFVSSWPSRGTRVSKTMILFPLKGTVYHPWLHPGLSELQSRAFKRRARGLKFLFCIKFLPSVPTK